MSRKFAPETSGPEAAPSNHPRRGPTHPGRSADLRSVVQRSRVRPETLSPDGIMTLQRAVGNRAVARMLDDARRDRTEAGGVAGGEATTMSGVQRAAHAGIASAGEPLPYLRQLQESFGPDHDLSRVRAHIGAAATSASCAPTRWASRAAPIR